MRFPAFCEGGIGPLCYGLGDRRDAKPHYYLPIVNAGTSFVVIASVERTSNEINQLGALIARREELSKILSFSAGTKRAPRDRVEKETARAFHHARHGDNDGFMLPEFTGISNLRNTVLSRGTERATHGFAASPDPPGRIIRRKVAAQQCGRAIASSRVLRARW